MVRCGKPRGGFPHRTILQPSHLPNIADDFAAGMLPPGLAVRHQAAAGAQDGDSHPVLNSRYSTGRCVNAQPRLADPLELLEHRLPLRPVLQEDADDALLVVLYELIAPDELFLRQDLDDLQL